VKLGLGVCHLVSLPPTPVDFVQSIHLVWVKFGLGGEKIDFVGKVFILGWLAYQGTHFVLAGSGREVRSSFARCPIMR
jgi:hypothetical protein